MNVFVCLLCWLPVVAYAQAPQKTCPYDSAHFSWRKPVPRNRLRELQPDRPGVTESPFTVDAGHAQLEVDAVRLRNSGSGQETRTRDWNVANSLLKFGLSRRTDVQLELPLYSIANSRQATDDDWAERHAGFGDATLRVKHNFVGDDQQGTFAMAVIGFVRLPTGGTAGDGATEYGILFPIDVELGENTNLEAQLETDLNYNRDENQRFVRLMPSLALEHDFTKRLGLITEGVLQWNSLEHNWQASLNVAPLVKITENFQVDAGTHLAMNRLSDHEYFVGFTLRR